MTACSVDIDGKLGKKVEALDPIACSRTKPPTPSPADYLRERWAELANEALEKCGHDARIDHRSLKDQGIDRVAQIHVGKGWHIKDSDRMKLNDQIIEYNEAKAELKLVSRVIAKIDEEIENIAERDLEQVQTPTVTREASPEPQATTPIPTEKSETLLTFDEIKDRYEEAQQRRIKHPVLSALGEQMSEVSSEQHKQKADQDFLVHVEKVLKSIGTNGQKETFFKLADEDLYQDKPRKYYESLAPLHKAYKKADAEYFHAKTPETAQTKKQARANYAQGFNDLFSDHLDKAQKMIKTGLNATLGRIAELKKEVVQMFGKHEIWRDIFSSNSSAEHEKQKTKSVEL
jgi:hypothetical protein